MSDLLTSLNSTARSLDAQRFGMDVTGQNIANVNTPGYSRRTIDLVSVAPYDPTSAGGGVEVVGVRALRDRLLDRRLQQELPAERREAAVADALRMVEAAIGRPGESLDVKMNAFFDSFAKLADNPTSSVARQEVLLQGGALATSFQDMASRLRSAQSDADQEIRGEIVILADVFEEFLLSVPPHHKATGPLARIRARVVDRDFVLHCLRIRARESFDHVELFGVR